MTATQHMHIAYQCRDRLAQERFYARFFGFRRARVFAAGTEGEFVMLRRGNLWIELFAAAPDAQPPQGSGPASSYLHLALEVDDIERSVAELAGAGHEMGPIVDCGGVTPGLRICFFKDPEGNVIELMQGWRDEDNPPAPV
jgi:glyoxylase I family protein